MITVFGKEVGFPILWLLEEMGLAYCLDEGNFDPLGTREHEADEISPSDFIAAIRDDEVEMIELVAIIEYLVARYGPTAIAPTPNHTSFPAYKQFLQLGHTGLAAPIYFLLFLQRHGHDLSLNSAMPSEAARILESRRGYVNRKLAESTYIAGDTFTAADISVTYALLLAQRANLVTLGENEKRYVMRTTVRNAYGKAAKACNMSSQGMAYMILA